MKKIETNQIKKTVTDTIRETLITDEVFWESEVQANKLTALILLLSAIILVITLILNEVGIYHIDRNVLNPLIAFALFALMIPWGICFHYRGQRPWLKFLLMFALTGVYGITDCLMTYRVVLIMAVPVIVSSRYYSKTLTTAVAVLSSIVFGLSSFVGVFVGMLDLNFVTIQPGTTIHVTSDLYQAVERSNVIISKLEESMILRNFLPKYLVFVMIAVVAIKIAERGHNMVLEQSFISHEHSRVETELNVARTIQQRVLPIVHSLPSHPEFDIAATMHPAKEVAGDFYDFIMIDPTHVALMIADVSGKGVPAALFMMVSKIFLDNSIGQQISPGKILAAVNHQLCEKNLENMFVTVWLGILDLETGRMITANAGHEYPLLCRKNGEFELVHDKHGLVLGGMDGVRYPEYEITLQPGDTLFVYTDGVTEACNHDYEQFGTSRLIDSLNRKGTDDIPGLLKQLKQDIDHFAGNEPQFDDITMLAFRLDLLRSSEGISIKPTPETLTQVEAYLEQQMEMADVGMRQMSKLNIAIDEIYTNIVTYSDASWAEAIFRETDDAYQVIFRDNGIPYDPLAKKDPDVTLDAEEREIGGLGIFIARKILDDLQYTFENGSNVTTLIMKK